MKKRNKQIKKEMLSGIENEVSKSKLIANNTVYIEYIDGRKEFINN